MKSTGESTNGAFGLIEQLIPAGFASPYHIHHLEDEAFYVLEGEVMFVRDGKWLKARSPATWSSVTERANFTLNACRKVCAQDLMLALPTFAGAFGGI